MIKGILEQITTSTVNLVNADLLAKNRGLRIRETFVFAEGKVRPASFLPRSDSSKVSSTASAGDGLGVHLRACEVTDAMAWGIRVQLHTACHVYSE